MQFPTINLNGTSANQLLEQYVNACDHLRQAIAAVGETCPNGRDYQIGPGNLQTAISEHTARMDRLRAVLADMNALAEHVV